MLKPSPAELLGGVADALTDTVLGELERGPVRNQVQAAIGIIRRCATAVAEQGPILHADCVDITASLRTIAEADPSVVADRAGLGSVLQRSDEVMAQAYPSVVDLTELDLQLREVLTSVAVTIESQDSTQAGPLRELFARMLDREQNLGLSPW